MRKSDSKSVDFRSECGGCPQSCPTGAESEGSVGWRFDARSAAECGNLPVPLCPLRTSMRKWSAAEWRKSCPGVSIYDNGYSLDTSQFPWPPPYHFPVDAQSS